MKIDGLELSASADGVSWRETEVEGVRWKPLHLEGRAGGRGQEEPADACVLIEMAPGCGYPAHEHRGVEEVLILAGGYRDERGTHTAGSYLRYEAGSVHAPIALGDRERAVGADNPACLLFATAREGVRLLDEDAPPAAQSSGSL